MDPAQAPGFPLPKAHARLLGKIGHADGPLLDHHLLQDLPRLQGMHPSQESWLLHKAKPSLTQQLVILIVIKGQPDQRRPKHRLDILQRELNEGIGIALLPHLLQGCL